MKANRLPVFIGLMLSLPAQAHTGAGTVHGFIDGLLHPLLGIDHLLVMLAIGLWAAMRGGRALWLLPMSFLLTMAAGAGVSLLGIAITAAESWVAFSVLACGWLVWSNCRMSSGLAVVLAAVFAFGHGYVHAAELQAGADAVSYAAGFLLTTALLHGLGIAAGLSGSARLKTIGTGFGLLCAIVGTTLLAGA
ncbi:HupE/UreJ family protein [Methylobacter luteus]|uniref:HupE/UreJ family protein n=1 Tax=Methylobacter luteus TaxID=415 RepID=UPI0004244589|nr:HupE/UreJ family protein [Methylobacter luteus]